MTLPGFENLSNRAKRLLSDQQFVQSFLAGMKAHRKDNPIISNKIESKMGLTGPEVRDIVRHLRRLGNPICSSGKGYYWTHDPDDLQQTIDHLESRARVELVTAAALKKTVSTLRCGGLVQMRLV